MCNLQFYLFCLSSATFYQLSTLETSSPVLALISMNVDSTIPILISTQTDGNVNVYTIQHWLKDLRAVCNNPSTISAVHPRSRPTRISKTGMKREKHKRIQLDSIAPDVAAKQHTQPVKKHLFIPAIILKWKPHQNGVNGVDALYVAEQLIVATGGDDQQIIVTRIHLDTLRQNTTNNYSQIIIPHAHRSAVKALKLSKYSANHSKSEGSFSILSSGYDQQLGNFKLVHSGDQITEIQRIMTMVECEDISTVDLVDQPLGTYHILVAGRGFEYVRMGM
jgi:hypothetical protein